MLRKLKQQVSQAVGGSVDLQRRSVDGHVSDDQAIANNDSSRVSSHENIQGFLCPICMTTFGAANQLQTHFATSHNNGNDVADDTHHHSSNFDSGGDDEPSSRSSSFTEDTSTAINNLFTCPHCFLQFANADLLQQHYRTHHEDDTMNLKFEVNDLRVAVQEEKWYSNKLKEELDRLQANISGGADFTSHGTDDIQYWMQQIQMLEAGKAMVTQRMLELDKEVGSLKRSNEALIRDKDNILNKSAHLAKEVVSMKSQLDEGYAHKMALGDELVRYREMIANLEKQLDQRPSEDDVAVLRKELIHAQQLMDTITLEKEHEISEHLQAIDRLQLKTYENEETILVLRNQLDAMPTNEYLTELQLSIDRDHKRFDQKIAEINAENERLIACNINLRTDLNTTATNMQNLQNQIETLESDIRERDDQITNLKSKIATDRHYIDELNEKYEKLNDMANLSAATETDLKQNNKELQRSAARHASELTKLNNDLELAMKEVIAGSDEISRLQQLNKNLEANCSEKTIELDEMKSTIFSLEHALNDTRRQSEKLSAALIERDAIEQGLRQQIESLNKSADDMLLMISEDEATKAAIDQLSLDKQNLSAKITALNQSLTQLRIDKDADIDRLEQLVFDKSTLLHTNSSDMAKISSKLDSTTAELSKFVDRCRSMEVELEEKSAHICTLEAAKTSERLELEDSLRELRLLLDERKLSMTQLANENENLKDKLTVREQSLEQKETALGEERVQLADAIQKIQIAETKAQQMAERLSEAELGADQLQQNVAEIERRLNDALDSNNLLQTELKMATDQIAINEKSFESERTALQTKYSEVECRLKSIDELRIANELKFDTSEQQWRERIDRLNDEHQTLITATRQHQLQVDGELHQKVESLTAEIVRNQAIMDDVKAKANESLSEIENRLKQQQNLSSTLQEQLHTNIASLETSSAELKMVRSELHECRERLARQDSLITELERNLAMATDELVQIRNNATQTSNELEQMLADNRKTITDLENVIADKKNEIDLLTNRCNALDADNNDIRAQLDASSMLLKNNEEKLNEKTILNEEMVLTNADLQVKVDQLTVEMNNLENDIENRVKVWENERKTLEDERNQLREDLARINDVTQNANQEILKYQEAAITLKSECNNQLKLLEDQLKENKQKLQNETDEYEKKYASMTLQIDSLNAELLEVRRNLSDVNDMLIAANEFRSQLDTARNEHEKQVLVWLDEKRVLMERCLKTESDLEFERERSLENKRRFDDALAAMHELGRANQSLQIDMSKQFSRKWLDDSEAVNCTSCGKQFSLTIRKHHCRNCGFIFCADCTSHTAQVGPSSRRPVRVCQNCFTELSMR